jgi:hypothetical protein
MRRPLKDKEGQIAIALVVMVIEGEFLLAMGGIIGVIQIEHDGGGGLRVTGDKLVHKGLCEPIEVFAVYTVFEP